MNSSNAANPVSSTPEYLVCLECETPCYVFEWRGNKLIEILCHICGNEDTDTFALSEELDALHSDWESRRS